MPEGGRYEKLPRPESIDYFISGVLSHHKVIDVERIDDQLFRITKTNNREILIHLTNIYVVSQAEVIEIMAQHKLKIDAIITISSWNSYSESGKEIAKENDIALFIMNEFMGALNFDGKQFINYLTPSQREELEKKKRSL